DYTDLGVASSATVTGTLGSVNANATITVVASAGHLVINEVDYDNPNTDSSEFVEIYNPGTTAVDLKGYQLVLVNGANNASYLTVDLGQAQTLPGGHYLVVGASTVVVPATEKFIAFAAASNNIQNGAPDGVALVDSVNKKLVDALSYEGSI